MSEEQAAHFHKMNKMLEEATDSIYDYWIGYSHMGTWQFWLLLAALLLPLLVLALVIDRRKALLLGFYGFNVHAWFHYCDLYTSTHGLTNFPYKVMPFLPVSITLDSSLVPVSFMLMYQWTLNRKKNYYFFSALLSAVFAFALKPLLSALDLFWLHPSLNYYVLFIHYLLVSWVSYWLTSLFRYAESVGGRAPAGWRR